MAFSGLIFTYPLQGNLTVSFTTSNPNTDLKYAFQDPTSWSAELTKFAKLLKDEFPTNIQLIFGWEWSDSYYEQLLKEPALLSDLMAHMARVQLSMSDADFDTAAHNLLIVLDQSRWKNEASILPPAERALSLNNIMGNALTRDGTRPAGAAVTGISVAKTLLLHNPPLLFAALVWLYGYPST